MSSQSVPWFKFYPADFMNGVRGLTATEVGLYQMLLCRIYEENGPVEFHTLRLSTYCGMREATFKKTVARLIDLGKLTVKDGALMNARAAAEISNRARDLENNSKAGKASAKKRQQKQQQNATDDERAFNHTDTDTDTEKKERAKALLSSGDDERPAGPTPEETQTEIEAKRRAAAEAEEIASAVSDYNVAATASGWPTVQKLTTARKAALRARLKDAGGIEGWRIALSKARASPHCNGQNDRGWTASFDFLTQQSSFAKLMEGNYDPRPTNPGSHPSRGPHPIRNGQPGGLVGAAMRSVAGREH